MAEAHVDQPFATETFKCYARRARAVAERAARDEAKKSKRPDGWDDGLFWIARPLTEEEKRGN